ncbi:MAG: GAF domain-containing protein, partial [Acidobacteriota bacterium]
MQRSLLTTVQLSALVVLSAAGLFVGDPLSWDMFRFSEPGGWLRSIFLILLMGSLLTTSFGFALKRRRRSDEFAFLAVLACGVNFLVQLKGGLQSPWQGLYLILTGLAAVAFPARLVGLTVGLVFALELSNWLLHQMGTMEDLLRLSGLLLLTVVGFGLMERTERHRIDGVQEELNKLNLGLERLTEPETGEPVSPLSREGKRSGRVEYVRELDKRLGRLLELARLATESQGAFLLQSDESCEILAVQSAAGSVENVSPEPFGVSGGLLAEVVREDRALAISEPARSLPRLPWYRRQPKLHSLLAIPIRGWERRRRVLVFDHLQAGHFNDERQKLAHGAVEQMAEWETWFRRQAKLEQDSKEFQRLHEASARLAEALRVEEILQLIHGFCSEVSHFDTFAVCLVEEGQEEFTVPVAEGYPSGVVGASFPVASHSWAAWMLRGREEPLSFD